MRTIEIGMGILGIVFLGCTNLFAADQVDQTEGELELVYSPKICITTPCPQFDVIKLNGVQAPGLGADVENLNPKNSALTAFRSIMVKGTWVKEDNYLRVQATEWSVTIREKLKPAQKPE